LHKAYKDSEILTIISPISAPIRITGCYSVSKSKIRLKTKLFMLASELPCRRALERRDD